MRDEARNPGRGQMDGGDSESGNDFFRSLGFLVSALEGPVVKQERVLRGAGM